MRASAVEARAYQQLVRRHTPRPRTFWNVLLAFVVGGSICATAQIAMNYFLTHGFRPEKAGALTAGSVILLGAALTALGLYDEIARIGGMGASLPISGFANAMVSPAMEYRREGWVMGVGAKIFTVAGPVIVYGLLVATLIGGVYLLLHGAWHLPLPKVR